MYTREISAAVRYLRTALDLRSQALRALDSEAHLSLTITEWAATRTLSAEIKALRAQLVALDEALAQVIIPGQLDKLRLRGAPHALGTVSIRHHFGVSQATKDKQKIHDWLRAQGMGDLVVPTVNNKTLSAALKEPFTEGTIDIPSDLLTVRVRRYASLSLTGESDKETEDGTQENS